MHFVPYVSWYTIHGFNTHTTSIPMFWQIRLALWYWRVLIIGHDLCCDGALLAGITTGIMSWCSVPAKEKEAGRLAHKPTTRYNIGPSHITLWLPLPVWRYPEFGVCGGWLRPGHEGSCEISQPHIRRAEHSHNILTEFSWTSDCRCLI